MTGAAWMPDLTAITTEDRTAYLPSLGFKDNEPGRVLELVAEALHRQRAEEILANHRAALDPAPPVDIGTLAEVLARPPEPPARVEGLLPSGGTLLLSAQRKTGKTTWCLNLARCLLTGAPFLGRFPVRQVADGRSVALLNFEVSAAQIARWSDEAGVPHDRLVLVNLRGTRNLLDTGEGRAELVALLRAHEVEVLLVDPFGRAFQGKQNAADEVGQWLVGLDRLAADAGVQEVVLTAHAGKTSESARGSSALEDWPDSIVWLVRSEDGERFMSAEGRDVLVEEDRLVFHDDRRLTLSGSGSRKAVAGREQLDRLVAALVEVVRDEEGVSQAGIERAWSERGVGHQRGDAGRASREAEVRGLVRVEIGARKAREHRLPNLLDDLLDDDLPDLPATSPTPAPGRSSQTTSHLPDLSLEGGGWRSGGDGGLLESLRTTSPMSPTSGRSPNGSAPDLEDR